MSYGNAECVALQFVQLPYIITVIKPRGVKYLGHVAWETVYTHTPRTHTHTHTHTTHTHSHTHHTHTHTPTRHLQKG